MSHNQGNLPSEREIKIEGFGGRPPFGGRPGALGPLGPPLNPALPALTEFSPPSEIALYSVGNWTLRLLDSPPTIWTFRLPTS